MRTRDEYVETMKTRLDEWNEEITRLEKSLSDAQGKASRKIESQLAEAKDRYSEVRKKVEEIKASDRGWDDLKAEAEHVWKVLRQSANYLRSEL